MIRYLVRIPVLYQLAAFLTAKRVVVRGRSMLPALEPGERVLFDRLAYMLDEPRMWDLVLARHPARPGVRMIKRVAALPGEDAPRRDGPQARLVGAPNTDVLDSGEYWLLGDNAEESTDSRVLGAFRREDIVARGWVVYWPAERVRVIGRP